MGTEAKRSKGITILAWLAMIVSAGTMLFLFDRKDFFAMYKFLPRGVVMTVYCYSAASAMIGLVASIGILQLKERMRKIAVVITTLDVLGGIPFFFFLPQIKRSIHEMTETMLSEQVFPVLGDANGLAEQGFLAGVSTALAGMMLNLIFLWYFTRPKVKAQFR